MESFSINTANTLSVKFRPGEDTRIQTTTSDSIFTFGDYRIFRDTTSQSLSGDSRHLRFDSFSTLDTINGAALIPDQKVWVKESELQFEKTNPQNYSYFGSFYTDSANAINSIIDNFPYAMLSFDAGTGVTITNYVEITGATTYSSFRIPYSAITNQGDVLISSGATSVKPNLYVNFDQFAIQLSGDSISSTPVYEILTYNFINLSGASSYLEFSINGSLFGPTSATTSVLPIYIRPSRERYNLYIKNLSSIERLLLVDQHIHVPNTDDDGENVVHLEWPKNIDGFNPDTYGYTFDEFQEEVLKQAGYVDDVKTNWIMRTMVPENYLDYDTEGAIYRKMIQVYAHQFDELKRYIDGIAYAHTVRYEGADEAQIPNKFLPKLAELLAWDLQSNFDESDLFEYLAGDVDSPTTTAYQANLILWKKILSNINWLYKKKGTRDALTFIFKLVGAPDEIVNFNEFVYKINRTNNTMVKTIGYTTGNFPTPILETTYLPKVNENGYINYDESLYIFQEGGPGRGNGKAYIEQWKPEFNPERIVDNKKVTTGSSEFFGTENIVNTKEVNLEFTAAKAIESDIKEYYLTSGSCINNGFIDNTDLRMEKCEVFTNQAYSSSTINEYLDYIYTNSIDPTNRKTISFDNSNISYYPTLKKAYLNYYFNVSSPSRKLTMEKLEGLLEKLGSKLTDYVFKLIPATTIFDSATITYRNTLFDAPKYVYKEGLNRGSEFRIKMNVPVGTEIGSVQVATNLGLSRTNEINVVTITGGTTGSISLGINSFRLNSSVNVSTTVSIGAFNIVAIVEPTAISITPLP